MTGHILRRTTLSACTGLMCLSLSQAASAQRDPAWIATLAHTGEWVTCPDTGQRVARVKQDIPIGSQLMTAQFTDWQRPFRAPHEGDDVVRCPDGQPPFDPNNKGLHVEDAWRR